MSDLDDLAAAAEASRQARNPRAPRLPPFSPPPQYPQGWPAPGSRCRTWFPNIARRSPSLLLPGWSDAG